MSDFLDDFIRVATEESLGVYGIHVYQKGQVVAEHRFRSDDRINLYSGSKTFAAVGIGIAEQEGLIRLTDTVLDFFPEYKIVAFPGSEKIQIRHLLQMSSGHMTESNTLGSVRDRALQFFEAQMICDAGTMFYYESNCTYMLGRIIEKVTGENMLAYLKPRLFDQLGIFNPQWHTCVKGHTLCSTGLHLTTEEYSRLGIALLENGVYQGKRIVSADYIKRMRSDLVDTRDKDDEETQQGYGYQVWQCSKPNTFRADGMYGQLSIILLDYDAVITVTAHNEDNHKEIIRAIWQTILPKL